MKCPENIINAKDMYNNTINLYDFRSYMLGNKELYLYHHTGQTSILKYESQDEAICIYNKILKLEKDYDLYIKSLDDDYDIDGWY